MSTEENDPDTLQLLDELDTDWTKRWHKKAKETRANKETLTFIVLMPEKKAAI